MLWMQNDGRGNAKGKICPACQIPEGWEDDQAGRYLQAWDSGFAGGVLRVQEYQCKSDSESNGKTKK